MEKVDNLTQEQRRKNMQHIRSKDTSIEIVISTTLIISKKPVTTGKSRDKATEFTTKLLLLE